MSIDRTGITEGDLHAYTDDQLPRARRAQVEAHLARHAEDRARVAAWVRDIEALRERLAPVSGEPTPVRAQNAPPRRASPWRRLAVAASLALSGGALGWLGRSALDQTGSGPVVLDAPAFARRAAVAHVVYSPEVRRPVEVGVDKEDQLVAWLSARLQTSLKPPPLGRVGYELIGGRLLPGEHGPVAQFMYHDAVGQRLTLYVTREARSNGDTVFRFSQEGPVSVFYWIDGNFGYALSAGTSKDELYRVAQEVHRQLALR